MSNVQERLDLRLLIAIDELLANRHPDQRPVDTAMVMQRLRLPAEAEPEVVEAMSQLLASGDIRGKENRGDNRVLDLTVVAITDQGLERLHR
jgi:hypothetical protein